MRCHRTILPRSSIPDVSLPFRLVSVPVPDADADADTDPEPLALLPPTAVLVRAEGVIDPLWMPYPASWPCKSGAPLPNVIPDPTLSLSLSIMWCSRSPSVPSEPIVGATLACRPTSYPCGMVGVALPESADELARPSAEGSKEGIGARVLVPDRL